MRRLVAALALAAALGACGGAGGGNGSTAGEPGGRCGPDREEPLDPGSARHLLPGAPEPAYLNDPPTSGAHLAGATPTGVQGQPLPRPVQVAVLEAGGVLVQHRGLPDRDRLRVERLAGGPVVVAPHPELRAAVVATAWRHRLECRSVDLRALEAFIARHRGQGPDR